MSSNRQSYSKAASAARSACYLKHRSQKHAEIKSSVFWLACFISFTLSGQNIQWENWDTTAFSQLEFHFPYASKISITTSSEPSIRIRYRAEGEYQNDFLLQKKREGKRLIVKEIPAPQKAFYNDKLSAHKVVATQVELVLPEALALQLYVQEAMLLWEGNHPKIALELTRGKAVIKAEHLQGKIRTSQADVVLYGLEGRVEIKCGSGRCTNYHTKDQSKLLEIRSRQGDIVLNPS